MLFDNRWLYVGRVTDMWGAAFQIQITLWRRDRR